MNPFDIALDARDGLPPELARVREKLLELLRAQATRYTRGESTSLPRETVMELMASLCYTLQIDPSADPDALLPLADADLDARYAEGLALLRRKADRARQLAGSLCLSAPNPCGAALRDTLRGILDGLSAYDPRFFAHRVPGVFDYPLVRPVPRRVLGVDYVLAYLARLQNELRFLGRFPPHRALALLDGMNPDWRELAANLCVPIAANALGLALLGENPRRLHITGAQRERLLLRLANRPVGDVEAELFAAAHALCGALDLPGEDDAALLLALALDLAPRVHAACAAGDLSHVFPAFGLPGPR